MNLLVPDVVTRLARADDLEGSRVIGPQPAGIGRLAAPAGVEDRTVQEDGGANGSDHPGLDTPAVGVGVAPRPPVSDPAALLRLWLANQQLEDTGPSPVNSLIEN